MTIKELNQLYYLCREIEDGERRLEELRAKGYAAKTSKLDAMPGGEYGSSVEAVGTEIADLERQIERCRRERDRLRKFIISTEDSVMRQILTYRFEQRCSWYSVARKVGGGNTNDSVRKACVRYLEKSTKK